MKVSIDTTQPRGRPTRERTEREGTHGTGHSIRYSRQPSRHRRPCQSRRSSSAERSARWPGPSQTSGPRGPAHVVGREECKEQRQRRGSTVCEGASWCEFSPPPPPPPQPPPPAMSHRHSQQVARVHARVPRHRHSWRGAGRRRGARLPIVCGCGAGGVGVGRVGRRLAAVCVADAPLPTVVCGQGGQGEAERDSEALHAAGRS